MASTTSTLGPSTTDSYDPDGQLLSDGTNTYSFDSEGNRANTGYSTSTDNELSTDGTWNYSYDAAGNETEKVNIATESMVWLWTFDNAIFWFKRPEGEQRARSRNCHVMYDVLGNRIETR